MNKTFTDSTGVTYLIFLTQEDITDMLCGIFPEELTLRFSIPAPQKKDFEVRFHREGRSYFSAAFTDEENIILNATIEDILNEQKRYAIEKSFQLDEEVKKYETEVFSFDKIIQESIA